MFCVFGNWRTWLLLAAALLVGPAVGRSQESPPGVDPYEAAIQAAAESVAPLLVRIETLGGFEKVGDTLIGSGPTTGLVVSAEGHILSSAFNFAQKPAQILVYLPDNTRYPAQLVATDHGHNVVLLKIETDRQLPLPSAAPAAEIAVGQTAIAVGRAFDGDKPNLSVGVVSAVNRIWGRAIQTDAKISPNNYGGPLIDLRGRVLGILTPLSLTPGADDAGVELYDSGIGFAVPLASLERVLPRLKKGEDLYPGLMGISLKGGDLYGTPAVISAVQPNTPAYAAGFKAGDTVVMINEKPITRQAELKHALGPFFAGDTVTVTVKRGKKETLERQIKLIAKLAKYQHPFLGILPLRAADQENVKEKEDAADNENKPASSNEGGLVVRSVYPDSPAAKGGVQPGDVVIYADEKPIEERAALADYLNSLTVADKVTLRVRRAGGEHTIACTLDKLPETVPLDLPPARQPATPPAGDPPRTGLITFKLPEIANECVAYVPESYQANVPHGLVIWLHPAGAYKNEELAAQWKDLCSKYDLILVAPKSADVTRWQKSELEFIRKAADDIMAKYNIDRPRITAIGQDGGGAMAALLAAQHRALVRGVVLINSLLPNGIKIPENDPNYRLAMVLAGPGLGKTGEKYQELVKKLRDMNYPVSVLNQGEVGRPLTERELLEVIRWQDCLDRL
ncbi:MAG: PDZ domain-containing protein [Pirellulales bacterium]|nr:PDZ domain-containing protein [Pirellulales bacterium]